LVLTYNDQKFSTQTIPKTVNPNWNALFDITITEGAESALLEAICWDRDRFRKEYLGEFSLPIFELFTDGAMSLDDPANEVNHVETVLTARRNGSLYGQVEKQRPAAKYRSNLVLVFLPGRVLQKKSYKHLGMVSSVL
jgi:phosphatidylserine decarboxylase